MELERVTSEYRVTIGDDRYLYLTLAERLGLVRARLQKLFEPVPGVANVAYGETEPGVIRLTIDTSYDRSDTRKQVARVIESHLLACEKAVVLAC